jgi:2-polyprenyl-6-hydroxyphenyl methylase/3-demethylubiquinone-9 3-methyltransferase
LDINQRLLNLAKNRAANAGYVIDFRLGSATDLPWPDDSMDVCVAPELLEHVTEWEKCLEEFIRILRPGGVLSLSTTNKLCPIQHEYNLPAYSWYPAPIKRYIQQLAMTTRPELANFATYPAVNWFSFFGLRKMLSVRGFQCFDRFDVVDLSRKPALTRRIVTVIQVAPIVRWFAHVGSPSMILIAVKQSGTSNKRDVRYSSVAG